MATRVHIRSPRPKFDRSATRLRQGLHLGIDAQLGGVGASYPEIGLGEFGKVEEAMITRTQADPFLGLGDETATSSLGIAT